MLNPMLNRLNPQNNILGTIAQLKSNPNAVFQLMQNNPQFRQFVQDNKGKTPEQIASAYGVDLNTIKSLLR